MREPETSDGAGAAPADRAGESGNKGTEPPVTAPRSSGPPVTAPRSSGPRVAAPGPAAPLPPGAVALRYERGSLVVEGATPADPLAAVPGLVWDERVRGFRCLALHYRPLLRWLTRARRPYADHARAYGELLLPEAPALGGEPYPYQQEALDAWLKTRRGVVELPTGAGKTRLAMLAIAAVRRDTLVLVPTLDLVAQWAEVIRRDLGLSAGTIGGGSFALAPVTVSTYASAYRHGERFGNRFGFAIFDECHHLPGEGYALCAEVLIAPFRLGLSATPERADQRHELLDELVGPAVYRKAIPELSGVYLADYDVRTLHVDLTAEERERYDAERSLYRRFVAEQGLSLSGPRAWQRFVFLAGRTPEGRRALEAYHAQRHLAFAAEAKFQRLAELLHRHRDERVLVFTHDNRTAYEASRRFLLPLITHQTQLAERAETLRRFRDGRWPILVTSKVLNEGVDVPQAAVAVILSGNASVREHVQRLGRILRKGLLASGADKRAILYELLTRATVEQGTSERRRQHDAYR
jgi:superfamily II DNA or RNA helicase